MMATVVSRTKDEDLESEEILEIDEGCFCGTHSKWNMQLNVKGHWTNNKCKHCIVLEDKNEDGENIWMIPRVAVAANEGGYNSTALCIDCILEATLAAEESDEKA